MIVITGAAGFIGSVLLSYFNKTEPSIDIIIVDAFSSREKALNYIGKHWVEKIDREIFPAYFDANYHKIDFVFHLGARTDTTETDVNIFNKLNLAYSKSIWNCCSRYGIPMVYASSAATYGNGEYGYSDEHAIIQNLKPLNPYGVSKNDFDKWVLTQQKRPPFWAGLKFFNVYGPNEYHKNRMASVIFHANRQIMANGKMKLFKSHNSHFRDGQQSRDFIYVKDLVKVCHFLFDQKQQVTSGIYNLGTGRAETFETLALSVFHALRLKPNISYIDTPPDIRENYQYFTQANMQKLKNQGYDKSFYSLGEGIEDYVRQYLLDKSFY